MKHYKAVLFDMDGVIVDSMPHHAESWQKIFKDNYNIILSKEDIFRREGMSGLQSIVDIFKEYNVPAPSRKELIKFREKKLELFEKNTISMFPQAVDILRLLYSNKIYLGLVTGSLMRSVEFLLSKEILNMFKVIVTVDQIENGKPHPEPYLRGVDSLEVMKNDVLVIENAPLGIKSAKNAGLDCFAVMTSLGEEYLYEADRIYKNHDELYSYFSNMLAV